MKPHVNPCEWTLRTKANTENEACRRQTFVKIGGKYAGVVPSGRQRYEVGLWTWKSRDTWIKFWIYKLLKRWAKETFHYWDSSTWMKQGKENIPYIILLVYSYIQYKHCSTPSLHICYSSLLKRIFKVKVPWFLRDPWAFKCHYQMDFCVWDFHRGLFQISHRHYILFLNTAWIHWIKSTSYWQWRINYQTSPHLTFNLYSFLI